MGDFLVAIVAGLLALSGVLLGGRMSRRATSDALEVTLREERRREVHRTLADLVGDVRQKIDASWLLLPAMAKMSIDEMTEFVETDTGREAGDRERRISRSLVDLGLLVGDQRLRTALSGLEQCLDEWPDKAVGPVIEQAVRGRGDIDAILKGFAM